MSESKVIEITKDQIIPIAKKMLNEKRRLVVINGYVDKEGNNVIVYTFDVDGTMVSYSCKGEQSYPSITNIYGGSAQWCEEEICEMMPVSFEGLKKQNRLFLPDDFTGSGQILVVPMEDLKKSVQNNN